MKILTILLSALLLSGCTLIHKKPSPEVQKPLAPEIEANLKAQIDAAKKETQAERARAQEAAGAVFGAAEANRINPQPNLNTEVVSKELNLAQKNLPAPTPEKLQESLERVRLALSQSEKDRKKAEDLYQTAEQRAKTLEENLTAANKKTLALEKERDSLLEKQGELLLKIAQKEAELRQIAEDNSKAMQARNASLAEMSRNLNYAAIAATAAVGLALWLYPPAALPAGIIAAILFAASYLIATIKPWMVWTGVGVVLLAGGIWLYFSRRDSEALKRLVGVGAELKEEGGELWAKYKAKADDWFEADKDGNHPFKKFIHKVAKKTNALTHKPEDTK